MNLTIIIPVYNCAEFLLKGFENLKPLYNSSISFEIIYVNDGSTDNSLSILNNLEKENNFIKVITQKNQGSSGARNTAIEIAQGNYIQFLDSDDYTDIEKIISLLIDAQNQNLDLIGYRMDYVNETYNKIGERTKQNVPFNKTISGQQALIEGYQPSSICVFLFKNSFIQKNKLRITPKITHMDVEFMTRVMLKAEKVYFKDLIAYHYLQREGSITKPKTKEKLEQLLFDEIIIANLMKNNLNQLQEKKIIKTLEKNYNSVVWNLLWRFIVKPQEVSYQFKTKCLAALENHALYPIKGSLKSPFQNLTRLFFNNKFLYLRFIKYKIKND